MVDHTINITTAGAVAPPSTLSPSANQTVMWHNQGTTEVVVKFTGSWPFTGTKAEITVPASGLTPGNSGTYTVKPSPGIEHDPYNVERDGETTGSGEIDLGTLNPLSPTA